MVYHVISLTGPAIINGLEISSTVALLQELFLFRGKEQRLPLLLKRELEPTLPTIDLYPCCTFQINYLNIRFVTQLMST